MRKNQQAKTLGADPLTYQYVNFIVYERMNGKMSKMSYEEAKMLCRCNGYTLCERNGFYFIKEIDMVDIRGSKDDVLNELKRWSVEVDMNNSKMLEMENKFINVLESL